MREMRLEGSFESGDFSGGDGGNVELGEGDGAEVGAGDEGRGGGDEEGEEGEKREEPHFSNGEEKWDVYYIRRGRNLGGG